jgi:hypothetical protein
MDTAKRNACSRCRGLKLRCLLDTFAGHGKCWRCYETGNDCIFETIAPRQRRKRTDTRVAALEKQIAGLKAAIDQRPIGDDVEDGADRDVNQPDNAVPWKNDSQVDDAGPSGYGNERIGTSHRPNVCEETIPGLIGADVLPLEAGITLFESSRTTFFPPTPCWSSPKATHSHLCDHLNPSYYLPRSPQLPEAAISVYLRSYTRA